MVPPLFTGVALSAHARKPERPFTRTVASRPGELVQIDTSPLDVMALLDDRVPGRVEPTLIPRSRRWVRFPRLV